MFTIASGQLYNLVPLYDHNYDKILSWERTRHIYVGHPTPRTI